MTDAVLVEGVEYRYGDRRALGGVGFSVQAGELFGLLGPNGGGKTTLFRLMSTLLPVQSGRIELLGCDVARQPDAVRCRIGVTFQSPSVDGKLSVQENLRHQAHLYGLAGRRASDRIGALLGQLGLADRSRQRVQELSGGLKRRVEIAKSLIHAPGLLILDEPSTGLDPGARRDLWHYLQGLCRDSGVTVLVTTHLMEEAERCGRLVILNRGRVVAEGSPEQLRATIGGTCVTLTTSDPATLAKRIRDRFHIGVQEVDQQLRIEHQSGGELVRDLMAAFPESIESISVARPTLEDVFMARTGHRFWTLESEES